MEGYELDSGPYYANEDGSILAFKGTSTARDNLPILAISLELTSARYATDLPEMVDAALNIGLEQARDEGQRLWKILEMQVDVRGAPERYLVFHVLQWADGGYELLAEELRKYLWWRALLLEARPDVATSREIAKRYQLSSRELCSHSNTSVDFFRGARNGLPIEAKRYQFKESLTKMHPKLTVAINTALIQTQVQHPSICKVYALHLERKTDQTGYYLYHILEAMDRNVDMEIKRKDKNRPLSSAALWDFLQQTAEALAYAHSKVADI